MIVLNVSRDMTTPKEFELNCGNILRHIALMKKYGIKADYSFTWLAARDIKQHHPEVFEALKNAGMNINHHGTNRPPEPKPYQRIKGTDWEKDVQTITEYETHDIDPESGELISNRAGGRQGMKELLGIEPFSMGRFFQASLLYAHKQLGVKMAIGLRGNTGASTNQGWFLGVLSRPDAPVAIGTRSFKDWALRDRGEPLKTMQERIDRLDRTEFHAGVFVLHDWDLYADGPSFNRRRSISKRDQEKLWSTYEKIVSWMAGNRDIHIVTSREVYAAAIDDREKTLTMKELGLAADMLLTTMNRDGFPPEYVALGEDFLSLADAFQAFAQSLAYYRQKGKLPERVQTEDVLGPTELFTGHAVASQVDGEEVVERAETVAANIQDRIPSKIDLAGQQVNASEFLYVMAGEFRAIVENQKLGNVQVQPMGTVHRSIADMRPQGLRKMADPLTKLQFWTFKPARYTTAADASKHDRKPVYIYLFTHTEDHINHELSEERFWRTLPLLESYRKKYPQYNPTCVFQFYGADAQSISDRHPAGGTINVEKRVGLVDFIRGFRDRGVIEIGYHGAHEPTYTNNPFRNIRGRNAAPTWEEVAALGEEFFSRYRHPYTGDRDASRIGGLAKVEEVFGTTKVLSGLPRGDANIVNMAEKYSQAEVYFGLDNHGPFVANQAQGGYFDAIKTFSSTMSPTPDHAPEIFWMDNKLRTSATDGASRPVGATIPPRFLTRALSNLDRSKPHVIHMMFAGKGIYTKMGGQPWVTKSSPTQWAYANPNSPELPAKYVRSREEIEATYRGIDATLDYLVTEFFPDNPGSRFVSNADLTEIFGTRNFSDVSKQELDSAVESLLSDWEKNPSRPPAYVTFHDHGYFSLADMFQLLVNALADYQAKGELPAKVFLSKMYGPLGNVEPQTATFPVGADVVLSQSRELQPAVNLTTWSAKPEAIVPDKMRLNGGQHVNPAEFLYLMAQVYQNTLRGRAQSQVELKPASVAPRTVRMWRDMGFRRTGYMSRFWTLKPAVLSGERDRNPGGVSVGKKLVSMVGVADSSFLSASKQPAFGMNLRFGKGNEVGNDMQNLLRLYSDSGVQVQTLSAYYQASVKMMQVVDSPGAHQKYRWDRRLDRAISRNASSGIGTLLIFSPYNLRAKMPNNLNNWKAFVTHVVKRYSDKRYGPVLYYALLNEPAARAYWNDSSDNYALLLKATYESLKEANPSATMVLGSIPVEIVVNQPSRGDFFSRMLRYEYEDGSRVDDYFDVVDVHIYDEPATFKKYIDRVNGWLSRPKPMIMTETAGTSNPEYGANPAKQASDLIKRFVTAFALGIKTVCWQPFNDHEPLNVGGTKRFNQHGLLDTELKPKPSYYTFQLMVNKLKGFNTVQRLGDGMYKFGFTNKKPVYVLWSEREGEKVNLKIDSAKLLVTHIVENEGTTTPQTETVAVEALSLSASPIFVETAK